MKVELSKPNKSRVYFELIFNELLGFLNHYESSIIIKHRESLDCVQLFLTKKDVIQLRDFLNNKTKNWRK